MIKKLEIKPLLWLIPTLIVVSLFIIWPFITTLQNSFEVHNDRYNYNKSIIGTQNFENLFKNNLFKTSLYNTTGIVFFVAPLTIVICFLIAFLFSSLSYQKFKNGILSIIFIQFFISSYAIGMIFQVLFGSKYNILNNIFGSNTAWHSSDNNFLSFISISIFFMWRISVICIVLFVFGINNINKKYLALGIIDNLGFFKKLKYIYFPHLRNTFLIIAYIGIAESLFLYPTNFNDAYFSNGQTIMYFIIDGLNGHPQKNNIASSASIFFILYSFSIYLLIYLISKSHKIYRFIKRKKSQYA